MPIQCLSNKYLRRCGTAAGFDPEWDEELRLKDGGEAGLFVSRIYDSGQAGTEWNRLELDIDSNVSLEAHVWIADDMEEGGARETEELYRYVADRAGYHSNYRETLLYGKGCGRYARLALKLFPKKRSGERAFKGYRITFPKESFTRYLPAVYHNNEQLERFTAVQESIYLGMERDIDSFAEKMDYDLCGSKLSRLAKWMGWGELSETLDEDTLRRLLKAGISLTSRKGTCSYYTELTEILIGEKAVVIEEPELHRATLLIRGFPKKGWENRLAWLKKNVPLGIEMEIVVIHKTDMLDGQCFLDETAYLAETDSELADGGIDIDSIRLV